MVLPWFLREIQDDGRQTDSACGVVRQSRVLAPKIDVLESAVEPRRGELRRSEKRRRSVADGQEGVPSILGPNAQTKPIFSSPKRDTRSWNPGETGPSVSPEKSLD